MAQKQQKYIEGLRKIVDIGIELGNTKNLDALMLNILEHAREVTSSDGGTLYIPNKQRNALDFQIIINESLNIRQIGSKSSPINLPPVQLYTDEKNTIHNTSNVASLSFHKLKKIIVKDAYNDNSYDFSGTKVFDKKTGYLSKSFLTIPLMNNDRKAIAIMQLINAKDENGNPQEFQPETIRLAEALSSLASTAMEKQILIDSHKELWQSLIKLLASSIDKKSRYTYGHCQRVPVLTEMIARAYTENHEKHSHNSSTKQTNGTTTHTDNTNQFLFKEEDLFELVTAAWLHDIGKITTPEYIIDKSSKLETVYNRIHEIRNRFEILRRDAEIEYWKNIANKTDNPDKLLNDLNLTYKTLADEFAFIAKCNVGTEFMRDEDIDRIKQISKKTFTRNFDRSLGLTGPEVQALQESKPATPDVEYLLQDRPEHVVEDESKRGTYNRGETYNLYIKKGTLTNEERLKIQDHVTVTIELLENLPFPDNLTNVVSYAGSHHEQINGNGYPNKLKDKQITTPARIMAIADIFESLTASDRPYRSKKTLSECLHILKLMAKDRHIDQNIFEIFLTSGYCMQYAKSYMDKEQLDNVKLEDYIN